MKILIICALLAYCSTVINAYPSAPGTCNMNKMATIGHGPSQSTCPDCYGVQISTDSPSLVNIKLTGRYAYQGIILLVKDKYTNRTLGEFQDFDEELFTSVACDDDQDEEDKIEPDSLAVLGHIDPKLKEWPVNVDWNMVATKPLTELKLVGMVVIDYDNFHLIPVTEFKIKRKIIKETTTTESVATATKTIETAVATHTIMEVEHEPGTVIAQESNTLFLYVLSAFIFLYLFMSICFRQLAKRRSTTRKNLVSTLLSQPEEISLVTANTKDI